MGTGLAKLISNNGWPITLWTIEKEVAEEINKHHKNDQYLAGVVLGDNVTATTNLTLAARGAGMVIVAVPAGAVGEVMNKANPFLSKRALILSVSKGLDKKSGRTVCQMIKELSGAEWSRLAALMGPLFAVEIAQGVPSVGLLATKEKKVFNLWKKVLSNDKFFLRWSDDLLGAELAGALKNIYAILMGVGDGLGYGWNTKSATTTAVMRELAEVGHLLGAKKETMYGLAGLGDLLTTGFGETSRNRRFGELICQEKSVSAALEKIGQVVEGERTAPIAEGLLKSFRKQTPLLRAILAIIRKKADPAAAFQEILRKEI